MEQPRTETHRLSYAILYSQELYFECSPELILHKISPEYKKIGTFMYTVYVKFLLPVNLIYRFNLSIVLHIALCLYHIFTVNLRNRSGLEVINLNILLLGPKA